MTYTPPTSPLSFNFTDVYSAPAGDLVAFNLGVDSGGGIVITPISGNLQSSTEDATGAFSGTFNYPFSAIVCEVLCTLQNAQTLTESQLIQIRQGENLCDATTIVIQQGENLRDATKMVVQQGENLRGATKMVVQQGEDLCQNWQVKTQDLMLKTHKFDTRIFKELPPEFSYTPSYNFDAGVTLNERTWTVTTSEYVARQPIEFNLTQSPEVNVEFNLGLSDVETVTRSRQIFDNVSIYTPVLNFVNPFDALGTVLNHSYQIAGCRFGTAVTIDSAQKTSKESLFKIDQATPISKEHVASLQAAQRLSKDFALKLQTTQQLSKTYRALLQHAQAIWNSNKPIPWYVIDPPNRPPIIPRPETITFTIPTKTVYTMQNTITATLLDLTPLDVADISLNLDADSWAWQFSCKLLDAAQLPLVTKTDGTAVEIIITINGFAFNLLVEKVTRNRSFAQNSISLFGRSLTAELTQPYLQPQSATQSSIMTVQQLAELELPLGWSCVWQAQTWNVPANAFSYTAKTPIQVIAGIASDIGAIVVPSRNSRAIKILPRYPVLPWNFAQETPDLVIPDAAIESLTYRNVVPSQANGVYIHGSDIGGVLGFCRLTGTAGDRLSQTITNPLMTDVIGCRALGERILAAQWTQPAIQSVTLPVNDIDLPLAKIGDFVRINIDGEQVRGVVNSIAISASLSKVSQTLTIGEDTANVWAAFRELLPRDPLLVGTLSSTNEKSSLITLVDGGVIRVNGTGNINSKYYIRANRIESEAPNLMQSEIVV